MIFLLSGCMTLDFMFFNPPKVEAYVLENELVPTEQIEQVSFTGAAGIELFGAWAHQADPDAPVLIYFHGMGHNIEDMWPRAEYYWSWGYNVFVFDYRGFGRSEGKATAAGVFEEDGLAAVEYVIDTTGVPPDEILWMAHSLGGAVAVHTSDEISARAIVLQSVFASSDHILKGSSTLDLPSGWFFEGEFDNLTAIEDITAPVFIVHGLADDFIEPTSGPLLFQHAPDPKQLWQPEGVGHGNLYTLLPEEFASRTAAFLAAH